MHGSSIKLFRLFATMILVFTASIVLWGQSTGRLTGTVVDTSGAFVPQAKVACKNMLTGLTLETTSTVEGLFRFPELPIGTYQLTASHSGFQTLVRRDIVLLTGHVVDVKLTLKLGKVTERVEVSGRPPLVQTVSSQVQTTYDSREMTDLPLNGRNALQLVVLTPGTEFSGGGFGGQQEEQSISVNGLRMSDTTYQLDGGAYTDRMFGSPPALPNPDALQEFTVQSSNVSAREPGAGAVVQLSTRSGTNDFHGTLFEFLRNDKLDAIAHGASSKSPFKQNQYGGTLGGPIIKDKLFFFGSYQGTKVRGAPGIRTFTVPTAAMRNGDFSASTKVIVDPLTGQPFPENIIPTDRFDPVAQKIISAVVPLPNSAGNHFVVPPTSGSNADQYLIRADYNMSPKHRLTGRYFLQRTSVNSDLGSLPGIYRRQAFRNDSVMVRDSYIASPALLLVNEFTFTRTRGFNNAITPITLAGAGATFPPGRPNPLPELRLFVNGYFNLFSGGNFGFQPATVEWRTTASYSRGKHFLQFGGGFSQFRGAPFDLSNENGQFFFNGSETSSATIPNSGDSFADFLLGRSSNFAQGSGLKAELRQPHLNLWIQDDWKVLPDLTLNIGLRWDPWLPAHDNLGPLGAFEPGLQSTLAPDAPTGLIFSGDAGLPASVFPRDWNNLAPRFGFAWDFLGNQKSVLRGAYGIYYRTAVPLQIARQASQAPFRSITVFLPNPASLTDPYANYPGGSPFPFTPPTANELKDYTFTRPVAGFLLHPDTPTSYTQAWNLTIEQQLMKNLALSVGYVGNHSIHIISVNEGNPAVYGPGATVANTNERRIYAGLGTISLMGPFQDENYNGLQVGITKRTQRGLNIVANYVFSKTIDNASTNTLGGASSSASPTDPFNLGANRAVADFDVTHTLRVAVLYNLPNPISTGGLPARLLNNWQVNSIITASTGLPVTIYSGRDNSLSGVNRDWADQIGNPTRPSGVIPAQEWFNTAAFAENALGTFGTAGRNSLRAPGGYNVDFSTFKYFNITEKLQFQFRFEAFNLFNHGNLGGPINVFTSPNFGRILGRGTPRVLQFGAHLMF